MVNIGTLRTIVGFSFKGFGFFWSFADKFLCGSLCANKCSVAQGNTCSSLFLFVGIIFIVCGYALIVMKEKKKGKLETKIKRVWKKLKKV
jgi:hypothetical protein